MGIDRYKYLRSKNNSGSKPMPPIKIDRRTTDVYRIYNLDRTRLDRISAEIYGDDTYGWLILLANPEYSVEFDIPKSTVLRIPFPLREVITEFEGKLIANRDIK
jgi:hypothetical protein